MKSGIFVFGQKEIRELHDALRPPHPPLWYLENRHVVRWECDALVRQAIEDYDVDPEFVKLLAHESEQREREEIAKLKRDDNQSNEVKA